MPTYFRLPRVQGCRETRLAARSLCGWDSDPIPMSERCFLCQKGFGSSNPLRELPDVTREANPELDSAVG